LISEDKEFKYPRYVEELVASASSYFAKLKNYNAE